MNAARDFSSTIRSISWFQHHTTNLTDILQMLLILWTLLSSALSLELALVKNVFVQNNSYYYSQVTLDRINPDYTPSTVTIFYEIRNLVPNVNSYFDIFYYMDGADLKCYQQVIGNQSYLRTCSFLRNNYSKMKVPEFKSPIIHQQDMENITNSSFYSIVDNTQYPYPQGAYSGTDIVLQEKLSIRIYLSGMFEQIGRRLIFINVTIYIIYFFVIGLLYYRHRKNLSAITLYDQPEKAEKSENTSDDEEVQISKTLRQSDKASLLNRQDAREVLLVMRDYKASSQ